MSCWIHQFAWSSGKHEEGPLAWLEFPYTTGSPAATATVDVFERGFPEAIVAIDEFEATTTIAEVGIAEDTAEVAGIATTTASSCEVVAVVSLTLIYFSIH